MTSTPTRGKLSQKDVVENTSKYLLVKTILTKYSFKSQEWAFVPSGEYRVEMFHHSFSKG